jgi:hypothetical protein
MDSDHWPIVLLDLLFTQGHSCHKGDVEVFFDHFSLVAPQACTMSLDVVADDQKPGTNRIIAQLLACGRTNYSA